VWTYREDVAADVRHLTTFAAFANEHVTSGRLTFDAGLRLDAVSGDANGASRGISWKTWLPRGMLRWQIFNKDNVAAYAGYRRTAYQTPLNALASPAVICRCVAPTATSIGPLVARVGPGTPATPPSRRSTRDWNVP
jgi:outer membrane receptor protein involved in Fe transport